MALTQSTDSITYRKECRVPRSNSFLLEKARLCSPFARQFGSFDKAEHSLSIQSSNTQIKLKTWVQQNVAKNVYSSSVCNCQKLEVNKMLSIGECINKLLYTYALQCYSTVKRDKLSSHEMTWRKLKYTLLNEINPLGKVALHIVYFQFMIH